jgi:hypothetical protein
VRPQQYTATEIESRHCKSHVFYVIMSYPAHSSSPKFTMLTFAVNCTIPTAPFYFVSSPDVRGTLDILWSCLSTVFLCTWTVQHLSVPTQAHPRTTKQKFRKALDAFARRSKYMLLTAIVPEWPVAQAILEWVLARRAQTCQ